MQRGCSAGVCGGALAGESAKAAYKACSPLGKDCVEARIALVAVAAAGRGEPAHGGLRLRLRRRRGAAPAARRSEPTHVDPGKERTGGEGAEVRRFVDRSAGFDWMGACSTRSVSPPISDPC